MLMINNGIKKYKCFYKADVYKIEVVINFFWHEIY